MIHKLSIVCGLLSCIAPVYAAEVTLSEAPGTNLALTVSSIQNAHSSIFLNIYELTSSDIVSALVERIHAGVHVEILEEGQPVGGLSTAAKQVEQELIQAMQGAHSGSDRYCLMSGSPRRYRFDHAKYAVIDEENVLIGSENYSPSGNPRPGTLGNRGWEVFVHDASLASQFKAKFVHDSDSSAGDVSVLVGAGHSAALNTAFKKFDDLSMASHTINVGTVEPIFSPDTTASGSPQSHENSASRIAALIDSAHHSVDIEQMTFDSTWGKNGATNPLLQAVTKAAERGVQVRVLLNDERVFSHGKPVKPKNTVTVDLLNRLPNAQAKIANLKGMGVDYIHNKGLLIDGHLTLVSSINWDYNSCMNNREAAVLLDSSEVNAHYSHLFDSDWSAGQAPAVSALLAPKFKETLSVALSESQEIIGSNGGADGDTGTVSSQIAGCPISLSLSLKTGTLNLTERDDASFKELENLEQKENFTLEASASGCLLQNTQRSLVLELVQRKDGKRSLVIMGQTSGGKIFSIRSPLKDALIQGQVLKGSLYDGSGGSRDRLGQADLEITRLN